MVKKIITIFILFLSYNSLAQLKVEVKTDTTDYLVGDFIALKIKAEYQRGFILEEPIFRDSLKKFEIINEQPSKSDTSQNTIIYLKEFTLAFYDSAEVFIPAFVFSLKKVDDTSKIIFSSDSIVIKVHSLEVKPNEDIKDIKEPIKIPLNIWELILWILLLLFVLVFVYFIIKKLLKKKKVEVEQPKIVIPAHVIALTKLDELEKEKLWQNGKVKEYHSRITEIIREYFEKRFSFPALELTSSEQIQILEKIPEAKNILMISEEFFTNADLVKFAKFSPQPDLNDIMMGQAREIVNQTIPKIITVEEVVKNPEAENA